MLQKQKTYAKRLTPLLLVANLLLFLVYFIPCYVVSSNVGSSGGSSYAIDFIQEIGIWLLPPITAVGMLLSYSVYGARSALLCAVAPTLVNLVYTVPYYYLIGIENRLDTAESLIFAVGVSLIYLLIFYLHSYLLYLAGRRRFRLSLAREFFAELPPALRNDPTKEQRDEAERKAIISMPDRLSEGRSFNLSTPITLSIFNISLIEFLLHLALEVYETVKYLINYAGDYRGEEIFYIAFRFVFLLAMLFVSQAVCCLVKKFLLREKEDDAFSK